MIQSNEAQQRSEKKQQTKREGEEAKCDAGNCDSRDSRVLMGHTCLLSMQGRSKIIERIGQRKLGARNIGES